LKNFSTYIQYLNEKVETSEAVLDMIKKLSYTYGKISIDKIDAAQTIKNLVRTEFEYRKDPELPTRFYTEGIMSNTDLNLMKPSNKVRMFNYLLSLLNSKTIRGDNFEGLIAGLFNGVISTANNSRYDLTINDNMNISVKFLNSINENPVLGNIRSNVINYINNIPDITPEKKRELYGLSLYNFLNSLIPEGTNDSTNIERLLNDSFQEVTHFLIGFPETESVDEREENDLNISYYFFNKEDLIRQWVNDINLRRLPKQKDSYQIRLNLKEIPKDNKFTIFAPIITDADIEYLRISNISAGEKLLGSDTYRIRGSILNSILRYGKFKFLKDKNGKFKEYFVFDYKKYKNKRGHYPAAR